MKVHEILANEGKLSNAIAYPFVKMFGGTARAMAAKSQAIEKLSAQWAEEITTHGKISSKASDTIGKTLATDKDIINKATKQAEKIAAGSKYAKDVEAVKLAATSAGQSTIKFANALGYGVPVGVLVNEIYKLNQQLKAGSIDEATYNKQIQYHIGKCLTQMASIVAAGSAIKIGNGILKTVGVLPFGKSITGLISTLTPAAQAAFGVWLATPGQYGGAELFHKWFISEGFGAETARDVFGSWGKGAYDLIAQKAHSLSGGAIPNSPGNPQAKPKEPEDDTPIIPDGPGAGWDTSKYDSTTRTFK